MFQSDIGLFLVGLDLPGWAQFSAPQATEVRRDCTMLHRKAALHVSVRVSFLVTTVTMSIQVSRTRHSLNIVLKDRK